LPPSTEIDDGSFFLSEAVSLDRQSDAVRHDGKRSQNPGTEGGRESAVSDAMGKVMQQDEQDTKEDLKLKRSIDRAVPPSG
jgi:hypothetical protein